VTGWTGGAHDGDRSCCRLAVRWPPPPLLLLASGCCCAVALRSLCLDHLPHVAALSLIGMPANGIITPLQNPKPKKSGKPQIRGANQISPASCESRAACCCAVVVSDPGGPPSLDFGPPPPSSLFSLFSFDSVFNDEDSDRSALFLFAVRLFF
jgi:hypothetical protein